MILKILLDVIVVEQCIVDVEQKRDFIRHLHDLHSSMRNSEIGSTLAIVRNFDVIGKERVRSGCRRLNNAWRNVRKKAELLQVRVHDLKHTCGRRPYSRSAIANAQGAARQQEKGSASEKRARSFAPNPLIYWRARQVSKPTTPGS